MYWLFIFLLHIVLIIADWSSSRFVISKCVNGKSSDPLEPGTGLNNATGPAQVCTIFIFW